MPAFRAGRAGATVAAILVGLACGLPPGAACAEPSDNGSDPSSESGNSESNSTNTGTDAGVASKPTRVGPNASEDDIDKAEDAEDKAWQDADKASADLDATLQETIALMNEGADKGVLKEAASRMREDSRAILEAARADEEAELELLRLHEPHGASGSISGQGAIPTTQAKDLAAQHERSKEKINTALVDRAAAIESIQLGTGRSASTIRAAADLMAEQNALSQTLGAQSAEFDRIMADAARAEAQASTGQKPIDQAASMNEMMALSADLRAKLQEINNAQTAALRSLAFE